MAKEEMGDSMIGQVRRLRVGESYSRTVRIGIASPEAKKINGTLTKMRNAFNQLAHRSRTLTGNNFRVESGVCLTDDREAHLATVAVTRMSGKADEEVDI